jgi:voltage-gated potassium channel
VLTARTLNPNLHIVARAVEESAEPKLIRAGANRVIAPTIIGSHRMAQALLKPAVADFMDSVTADTARPRLRAVRGQRSLAARGLKLKETTIRSQLDIVVVAIRRAARRDDLQPLGRHADSRGRPAHRHRPRGVAVGARRAGARG